MAKDLANKPNTSTSDINKFPYEEIQDETANQDGTPVNKEVYQDLHYFFQKLMDEAGISFNGLFDNANDGFQFWDAFLRHVHPYEGPNKNIQSGTLPQGNYIDLTNTTENVFLVGDPNNNGPLQSINDLAGYPDYRAIIVFFTDPITLSSAGNISTGVNYYDVSSGPPYVFRKSGTTWYLESSMDGVIQILSKYYAQSTLEVRKDDSDTVNGYENGWGGSGVSDMTFYKNNFGEIVLEGSVTGGSSGFVAFQLPTGYRPPKTRYFACCNISSNVNYAEIQNNGKVLISFGSNSLTYLDGIRFRP